VHFRKKKHWNVTLQFACIVNHNSRYNENCSDNSRLKAELPRKFTDVIAQFPQLNSIIILLFYYSSINYKVLLYDTFVNGCNSGFEDLNCEEFARSTSARSPYGIYSNTIHGLFVASRSTMPFKDKIFAWPNVDMMSTSRIKSCSVSGVAVSFRTFIATISFVSPLCHSPVKFLLWNI